MLKTRRTKCHRVVASLVERNLAALGTGSEGPCVPCIPCSTLHRVVTR
jgi:hypothetical protein